MNVDIFPVEFASASVFWTEAKKKACERMGLTALYPKLSSLTRADIDILIWIFFPLQCVQQIRDKMVSQYFWNYVSDGIW